MKLYYDLHLHSCLSPCGDGDMTPNNIAGMSALKELDVIALSDHNTARNTKALRDTVLDNGFDLLVIPAIEVCTSEEVHMLCLFEDFGQCEAFDEFLYSLLPPIANKPAIFGEQLLMDRRDNVTGTLDKLLLNAASLSIDRLLRELPAYGGFAIPAHVDRPSYSIVASLGYIPPDYGFPCIEVKHPPYARDFSGRVITNSDAHYLQDIAEREHALEVRERSIAGVLDALKSAVHSTE